jgi:hypothetical protein
MERKYMKETIDRLDTQIEALSLLRDIITLDLNDELTEEFIEDRKDVVCNILSSSNMQDVCYTAKIVNGKMQGKVSLLAYMIFEKDICNVNDTTD